jgi:hypothetical protein
MGVVNTVKVILANFWSVSVAAKKRGLTLSKFTVGKG